MLQRLHLKNFKCFDELEIGFSNLNLLVGTNSSGKSSIIQSILLILHNISNNERGLKRSFLKFAFKNYL